MRPVAAPGTCGLLLLLAACVGAPGVPQRAAARLEPRPDWSTDLGRLLPAIRACLADQDAGGAAAVGVTKAWPIGERLAGARVLQEDGQRVDCVAAAEGDRVFLTERVHAGSRLQGERDPLYTPGDRPPPRSPCLASAAADNGWLSYDVCRDPRPIGSAAAPRRAVPAPAGSREG